MKTNTSKLLGGAVQSRELLAAFAVLAVVLAGTAVVLISDDASGDATTAGQATVGNYTVKFDTGLTATVSGNTVSFEGCATAGAQVNSQNVFSGVHSTIAKNQKGTWATVLVYGIGTYNGTTTYTIKQTNTALNLAYPDGGFANGTKTGTDYTDAQLSDKTGFDTGYYSFLIPKDGSKVTLEITPSTKGATTTTLTFDFSKVSTKIALVDAPMTGNGWTYTGSSNYELTLTDYSGNEVFDRTSALAVKFSGTNTINAYGTAVTRAISATGTLTVAASRADSSLDLKLADGLFGLVSSEAMTIGNTSGTAITTVLNSDGGNRAIYSVGKLTIQNSVVDVEGSEKAIRVGGGSGNTTNLEIDGSTVTATLSGTGQLNDKGNDDIFAIKTGSISVDKDSTVYTQGLRIESTTAMASAPLGLVQVAGGYTQNAASTGTVVRIAGFYSDGAITGFKAIRATPATSDKGLYLVDDAKAYNIQVVASADKDAKVTEETVTTTKNAATELAKTNITSVTLVISETTTGADLTVPQGKELILSTTGENTFSGTISTGSTSASQRVKLDAVKGTFTITKGSFAISDGTWTGGTIILDDETVMTVDDVTVTDAVSILGTGTVVIKAKNTLTVSAETTGLTIGPGVTVEVYGSIVKSGSGCITNNGKIVLQSGGTFDSGFGLTNVSYTDSDMETAEISGTTKGDLSIPAEQIMTVTGNGWTIAAGNAVTVRGMLIVPEGKTLTVSAGGKLILVNNGQLVVEGSLVIEEASTSPVYAAGQLTIVKGTVDVSGSIVANGDVVLGTADYSDTGASEAYSTGTLTIRQDGIVTVGETGILSTYTNSGDSVGSTNIRGKVVVNASATLVVNGLIGGSNIYNSGLVSVDSAVAATSAANIWQMADGAEVDVANYTVQADVTNAALAISDRDLVLTSYRVSGQTINVITGNDQYTSVVINAALASPMNTSAWKASISGISVVSSVGSDATTTSFTNSEDNAAVGKYNDKQYYKTMDVSGAPVVSYKAVSTATVPSETTVSNTGSVNITEAGSNAKVTVKDSISVGDNVTLTLSADKGITVSGAITAGKDATVTNAKTVSVSGSGSVTLVSKTLDNTVKAALYETSEKVSGSTVKTYHYVTVDAAIAVLNDAAAGVDTATLKGAQSVSTTATIPAGKTLDLGSKTLTVKKDKVLTVADGATVKNGSATVNGTLFAEDKTDVKSVTVTSDVYSEEIGAGGKLVKDGWAKWTSLVTALAEAEAGETITLSKDTVTLSADTVIPAGVTVDADDSTILLNNGVRLTVDGVLITDGKIQAQSSFGLTPMNLKVTDESTSRYASTVVVNGALMSAAKLVYGYADYGTNKTVSDVYLSACSPVAGAYYEMGSNYVISSLSYAAENMDDITSKITVNGAVSAGDISFVGTDDCNQIVIGDKVANSTEETTRYIDTVLTVGSMALSGITLTDKDSTGYFTGEILIGDAAIDAVHAKGLILSVSNSKVYMSGTVTIIGEGDSLAIAKGTVYSGEGLSVTTLTTEGKETAMTVASGAVFEIDNVVNDIDRLVVDGTVNVPSSKSLTVAAMYVNGTVTVASSTGTTAQGSLYVTTLYIGITDADLTGASATFSGPAQINATVGKVVLAAGAVVDEAFADSIENLKSTTVTVNGNEWFTAYTGSIAQTVKISAKQIPAQNVVLSGWTNENGLYSSTDNLTTMGLAVANGVWTVTIGKSTDLDAVLNTYIYQIVIKADEGVDNVYLNGQNMAYGLVKSGNDYYYAYTATVDAGTYNVTYTLKNGYSGTAVLKNSTGTAQSGNAFSVSGDASTSNFQLSGIEKSGYVDPVEPEKKDGLTVTDYLLIVLVILVVVLAVIVALRLMRS